MCLVDDDGRWAGVIRLPRDEMPGVDNQGDGLELIAIARGKVPNNSFPKVSEHWGGFRVNISEWECRERLDNPLTEFYEFYFAMCIGWRDAIAYRRGLGRVKAVVWESLKLDEINIILG